MKLYIAYLIAILLVALRIYLTRKLWLPVASSQWAVVKNNYKTMIGELEQWAKNYHEKANADSAAKRTRQITTEQTTKRTVKKVR